MGGGGGNLPFSPKIGMIFFDFIKKNSSLEKIINSYFKLLS